MGAGMRGIARNLLLAGASCVVVFGGAEAFLRLTGLAPSEALRSPDLRTLDSIPGLFEPGQEFTDRVRRDLPSRIRINNLGFRGRDLGLSKENGAIRILCLGDSYTFGDHVDDDEAFPARLEDLLDRRHPGRRVEVVNGGANGFSILDEAAFYETKASRIDPDIVVIVFSPNDVSDLTRPAKMIDRMREHSALKSRAVVGGVVRFLQRTAVFNAMQILAARARVAMRADADQPAIDPSRAGPDRAPEAWRAYHEALSRFGALLGRERRQALLVLFPSFGNVQGGDPSFASALLPGWAAESGMESLDLLPAMREAAASGAVLYLVPRDSHPSAQGHLVASEAIASKLDALGWMGGEEGQGPAR